MTTLWRFIKNLFALIFNVKPSDKVKKEARKEVKREEKAGGMDAVRKSTSDSFRRNR